MNLPPPPQTKMKPFFNHTICIKNSHTYQDFLRRRPKHAEHFRFSMIQIERIFIIDERAVQLKLLRVLKIAKPITKVDFGKFEVINSRSWRTTLKSAFKKIFRVKSLVLVRPQNNTKEKYFRYFVRLQDLFYQLDGLYFDIFGSNRQDMLFQNPLECLKYCPKIRSLEVLDHSSEGELTKISTEPPTHSLKSLESFTFIADRCNEKHVALPIELCKNLKSASLGFYNLKSHEPITQVMKDLSTLPNLQEIGLKPGIDFNSAFITACKKIAQKGKLKKVTLHFDHEISSNLKKILEAFKSCKLSTFSLKTQSFNKFISDFIKNMDQLESLELEIFKNDLSSNHDDLVRLCKQINKLQALRRLKLKFYTNEQVSKSKRISNFIPYLSDLFTKPIKIETFSLECNQLDPSEALQSLMLVLGNSATCLKSLSISFGVFPCSKKIYQSILKLMENLSNIQVLEIPSLEFNGPNSKFLNSIVEAVEELKYLRAFKIGNIKKTVAEKTLCRAIETISSKRGLKQFSCELSRGETFSIRKKADMINMEVIMEKNPSFELLDLGDISNMILLFKVFKWE